MTVAPTDRYYPPVANLKHLERLAVFSSRFEAREFWTEMHNDLQEQLAVLDSDIRQSVAGLRVTSGSTRGERFMLFSYRTFSSADSSIDPVVVGITFTLTDQSVDVEADVSGEETGDLILSPPKRTVPNAPAELLAAARESAQQLRQSAKAIVAALNDPSRQIE